MLRWFHFLLPIPTTKALLAIDGHDIHAADGRRWRRAQSVEHYPNRKLQRKLGTLFVRHQQNALRRLRSVFALGGDFLWLFLIESDLFCGTKIRGNFPSYFVLQKNEVSPESRGHDECPIPPLCAIWD